MYKILQIIILLILTIGLFRSLSQSSNIILAQSTATCILSNEETCVCSSGQTEITCPGSYSDGSGPCQVTRSCATPNNTCDDSCTNSGFTKVGQCPPGQRCTSNLTDCGFCETPSCVPGAAYGSCDAGNGCTGERICVSGQEYTCGGTISCPTTPPPTPSPVVTPTPTTPPPPIPGTPNCQARSLGCSGLTCSFSVTSYYNGTTNPPNYKIRLKPDTNNALFSDWQNNGTTLSHTYTAGTYTATVYAAINTNGTSQATCGSFSVSPSSSVTTIPTPPAPTPAPTPSPPATQLSCLRCSEHTDGSGFWLKKNTPRCPGNTRAEHPNTNCSQGCSDLTANSYPSVWGNRCYVATEPPAQGGNIVGSYILRASSGSETILPATSTSILPSIFPVFWWNYRTDTTNPCIISGQYANQSSCWQPSAYSYPLHYAGNGGTYAGIFQSSFPNDKRYQIYLTAWSDYFQPIGYWDYQQETNSSRQDCRCGTSCDDGNPGGDGCCSTGRRGQYDNVRSACNACGNRSDEYICDTVSYDYRCQRRTTPVYQTLSQTPVNEATPFSTQWGQNNLIANYCKPNQDARVDIVFRQILFRVSGTVWYTSPGAAPGSAPTPYPSGADTSLINLSGSSSYNQSLGTDSSGNYSFTRVPEGNNILRFSAPIGSNLRVSAVRINNGPQTTIPANTVFLNNLDQDTTVDWYLTYNPDAWIQTVGGDVHSDTFISLPNASVFAQGAPTCSLSSTANANIATATDLVSTPIMSRTLVVNPLACVISPRAAFAPYMIPTFDDLLSLYYTQAKPADLTANLITKHPPLTGVDDKTQSDIPLTSGNDHLYYIKKTHPTALDGNLTITGNISGNQTGVVFVDGNLTIGPIPSNRLTYGNSNSGLVFVVRGNVNIDETITQVDAVIISTGTIYTAAGEGTRCTSSSITTEQLVINGSLISLNPDRSIQFCRTLTDNNLPSEIINYQVKYLVILRNLMSDTFHRWNEIP